MSVIIQTKRLDLIPLSPAVLRAALELDRKKIGRLLGVSVPQSWEIHRGALELWLRQLEANPALQPWLARGMVLRSEGQLIGDIGCHSEPFSPPASAPKTVELGYSVMEAWRRRGFAQEAIEALIQWACTQHRVQRFVLSISPKNQASQALATKLSFRKIGSQIDEEDGLEEIFERLV
jgi:RimJ/RimL family protein N-acetyltransferase